MTEQLTKRRTAGELWSAEELRATVAAYWEMLQLDQRGEAFSKSVYRTRLLAGPLKARTPASVEFRMQNISAVLVSTGRAHLRGYLPARNVGAGVAKQLLTLLGEVDATLPDVFSPLPAPPVKSPEGRTEPSRKAALTTIFERDPAVIAWTLARADGVCECCGKPAPFKGRNGEPFLEVHHVQPLAAGGEDTPDNTVAICPNCHREAHYGVRAREVAQTLRALLDEL